MKAEKKLGDKLREFPKAKGTRGQLSGPGVIGGAKSEPPIETATLKEIGVDKIQRQVLLLRRAGRLPYDAIADATRWMRKPRTHGSPADALRETVRLYRKTLWADTETRVEIWLEKGALAGVVYPVTAEFDVPLMVTSGYTSETFAYEAVNNYKDSGQTLVVLALGLRQGMDRRRRQLRPTIVAPTFP